MLPFWPLLSWFPEISSKGNPEPTRLVTKSHQACSAPVTPYDMSPSAMLRSEPEPAIPFRTADVFEVEL